MCGVIFNSDSDKDKRTVLKNYLQRTEGQRAIILEEHFNNPAVYGSIELNNLYDVETLVACFANATIVVHESISTAAELGMLASNRSTASKLLVLYPDSDSVEEDKISTFIRLAYYRGSNPVLPKNTSVAFNPVLQKNYETNDRYVYHTAFPNDLNLAGRARNNIDSFLASQNVQPITELYFQKRKFNRGLSKRQDRIDYHKDGNTLRVSISPMALRCLMFSMLSIDYIRDLVEACDSISSVMSVLRKELDKLFLKTFTTRIGIKADDVDVQLKGFEVGTFQDSTTEDYRKAIGLFVYLLKALGFLSEEEKKRFKFTNSFVKTRDMYRETIVVAKPSKFAKHLQTAGLHD